jgi:hypothetical protein
MKSHINEIIEKMKETKYSELNFDLAFKLTNESERGAILIGFSKVEEYLEKLAVRIFPLPEKNYRNRLLDYPGPLSSFAGKNELLFAFRIIEKRLYNSLNTLRILRNGVAHSSNMFSLKNSKEKLEQIYDFEDGLNDVIHNLAFKNVIAFKKDIIKEGLENDGLNDYDVDKFWNEYVPNPEENKSIQDQLTIWKLAYGMTFLCMKIEVIKAEYSCKIASMDTWLDLPNI